MSWFTALHPILQGLIATSFTYLITGLGAAVVFCFKSMNRKTLDLMMGFAAGVMIAASFWSLLAPAIELSAELGGISWLTASLGFVLGGSFVIGTDIALTGLTAIRPKGTALKRSILLVSAVTLHNIPEGLAVGVAIGNAAVDGSPVTSALMLALGIGLQNFPEGVCVAMPLRRDGCSRARSFFIGQASGVVEPIAGVLGVLFALRVRNALPLALSFSAGAMIAVVCSELIPESFKDNKTLAAFGVLMGFAIMMILDVALSG